MGLIVIRHWTKAVTLRKAVQSMNFAKHMNPFLSRISRMLAPEIHT